MGLRGSLYDLMYRRNYGGAAQPAALPVIDYTVWPGDADAAAVRAHADYLIFADCVIRANPAAARTRHGQRTRLA